MNTPIFENHCNHSKESYVGSFFFDGWHDVYVFPNPRYDKIGEVCIRYGNEGSEYISPGGITGFMENQTLMPEYIIAKAMIGIWLKKEKEIFIPEAWGNG
jgi:hypothetical protein